VARHQTALAIRWKDLSIHEMRIFNDPMGFWAFVLAGGTHIVRKQYSNSPFLDTALVPPY
jgi:hypothetical protein